MEICSRQNVSEEEKEKEKEGTVEINPVAPGDFCEKRVLKLVEWFSGHCRTIKS